MVTYHENGVSIHPAVPSNPKSFQIIYNGLLPQSGATEVYAHAGYGRNWEHTQDYKMIRSNQGFEVSIPMPQHADSLNICFKDAANNWDNNTGRNYSITANNSNVNYLIEVAEEIIPLNDAASRSHSNLSMVREVISRWFKAPDYMPCR